MVPARESRRPLVVDDELVGILNTGKTAAFTTFGDFAPNHADAAGNPGFFDPLDGTTLNIVTGETSQAFGGFVQKVRPVDACVPKPIPPVSFDTNLTGGNPNGFRRSVAERAGPPYIGRGLMEAVPTADITASSDPNVENGGSSLSRWPARLVWPNAVPLEWLSA